MRNLTPHDLGSKFSPKEINRRLKPLRDGTKKTVVFETVHVRKDGSSYPTKVRVQRPGYDSKPVFVAVAHDLTERKKVEAELAESQVLLEAETALRESEERFRDLFENASDLIQSVLPSGEILFVNPAWRRTLQFTDDEIKSLNIFEIIHPEEHSHCEEVFKRVLAGDNVGVVHVRFQRKDGETVYLKGSISCRFEAGKPISTRAIFHDISEHILAEKTLRTARDTAESVMKTKSRFLAAASHDLRQPLQSLDLNLTTLAKAIEETEARELTDSMRHSLDTLGEILDVLLDVSQLDSGSIKPMRAAFNIDEMLDCLVTKNQPIARAKGLELRYEAEPCIVFTDRKLLGRILENFVWNSIQYTSDGEIVVKCRRVGDLAQISVYDTGIGMPKELLSTVFEEYYQVGNPSRDRQRGLGLGLSIVDRLSRLLDHPVRVNSELGVGSEFSVEIPLGTLEVTPDKADTDLVIQPIRQATPTILLVDDYPDITESALRLFKVWGMDAYVAKDGNDAIAQVRNGLTPNIIISDYRLPGMNGLELISEIRALTKDNLPAALLTGDISAKEVITARTSDISVLNKPVNSKILKTLVENVQGK